MGGAASQSRSMANAKILRHNMQRGWFPVSCVSLPPIGPAQPQPWPGVSCWRGERKGMNVFVEMPNLPGEEGAGSGENKLVLRKI